MTNLVTRRFHKSPRVLQAVLFVTDQWWDSDRSVLHQWLVTDQLLNGFQACADHSPLGLQYVTDLSVHYSIILSQVFTSTIFCYFNYYHWSVEAQTALDRLWKKNNCFFFFCLGWGLTSKSFDLDISEHIIIIKVFFKLHCVLTGQQLVSTSCKPNPLSAMTSCSCRCCQSITDKLQNHSLIDWRSYPSSKYEPISVIASQSHPRGCIAVMSVWPRISGHIIYFVGRKHFCRGRMEIQTLLNVLADTCSFLG